MSLCPVDHKACQCSATRSDPCPAVEAMRKEIARLHGALQDYFAAADAAWLELCQEAAKHGMKSVPILPGQAKALDKYNELRAVFGPNDRIQPTAPACRRGSALE